MKKTLLTCLAIVAVFAIASSASAVTCTIDQRPAATLLVPYFQVSYGPGGELISTGAGARDTIVTIGNASSSPMIAHVNVYDRFSELVLDFNVALTGFDLQAMRISDIIGGNLPNTPLDIDGEPEGDVCQRNPDAEVYPDPDGFIRVIPLVPATTLDNTLATTEYSQLFGSVALSLRRDCFDDLGPLAIGYIVIDHANYCNLSDPTDPNYYFNNALGNENNLFGEIIFTSGLGIPTYAMSTVNIEADSAIAATAGIDITRTFYARYWEPAITGIPYLPANNCPNCGSGNSNDLNFTSPWNIPGGAVGAGIGDGREPLGLKWAARWFDLGLTLTSNFRAWRSSTFNPDSDGCDFLEPQMASTFFDEDEQTTQSGVCPSPCTQEQFNFPLETQQENIIFFIGAFPGAPAGWVAFDFNTGSSLDQAWVDYAFEGSQAFETVLVPGTQLDPSSCNPLGTVGVLTVTPAIPTVPAGTGPFFVGVP